MSDSISCKVRAGWSFKHNTDLILGPDRIQLGDRELLATEVDWVRFEASTTTSSGGKSTHRRVELGNPRSSLKFSLHDFGSSTAHTGLFPEIVSIVCRFYTPRLLQKMIDTLVSGGSCNIGKLRFTPVGVEIPKKKHLIFSDTPVAVPWVRVGCGGDNSTFEHQEAIAAIITGVIAGILGAGVQRDGGALVFDSATEHQPSTLGVVIGTDSRYSTSYEETSWTPNACLVEPLVQFMRAHPEISGGPWYVARGKQKVVPFVWSQLLQMAAGGMLQPADMLLQEGAEKWSAAATIPGLIQEEC